MSEKHNVSISEKLYNDIKEYCRLNELKINIFVEELIRKSFNIEKFGDSPFKKKNNPEPEVVVKIGGINNAIKQDESIKKFSEKMLDGMKTAEKQMEEIVEKTSNAQEIQENVDKIVFDVEPTPEEKPKKRKITRLN